MEVISRGPQFLFLNAGDVRLELIRKDAFEGDKRLGIPGFTTFLLKWIT